jgi:hypothetical protein
MDDLNGVQILLLLAVFALVFWIPPIIAKRRCISDANMGTVRLLTILGVFFGVTWIVALVLACVYQPVVKHPIRNNKARPKSFDPIPESFMRERDSEIEDVLNEPQQEKCENCGRIIGKLETPALWKNHIVCDDCYEKLSKRKEVPRIK